MIDAIAVIIFVILSWVLGFFYGCTITRERNEKVKRMLVLRLEELQRQIEKAKRI